MGEIVNLKRARKQRVRSEEEAQAAANRAKFGRSKPQRAAAKQEDGRAKKALDGKQIESEE
jgi:hypothetical protein